MPSLYTVHMAFTVNTFLPVAHLMMLKINIRVTGQEMKHSLSCEIQFDSMRT